MCSLCPSTPFGALWTALLSHLSRVYFKKKKKGGQAPLAQQGSF